MRFKTVLLYIKIAFFFRFRYWGIGILGTLLWTFTSCNVSQFLTKDQYIVSTNKINIQNISNKKAKKNLEFELTALYRQKELPKFLFFKRKIGTWFYFKSQLDSTPTRFRRWQYKSFSLVPAIFSEQQTESTCQNMRQYLINSGYRSPVVTYDKDFHNKDKGLADVTYHIQPGSLYVLDTVQYKSTDTAVLRLINEMADERFLKKGAPLSLGLYEQERQRITSNLNNGGYARFTSNYISSILADTIDTGFDNQGNKKTNVLITIQTPNDSKNHQKFFTSDVIVYPSYDARLGETIAKDSIVEGKIFFTYDGKLDVKPQVINKSLDIAPWKVYNKTDIDNSIKKLTNLGVYKFVNIKPNIEDCDSTLITYKVYLTPNKKMSYEYGVELNYSNIFQNTTDSLGNKKTSSLSRIGIAGDISFEHKNLLGGAERLSSSIAGGVDIGLGKTESTTNGLTSDFRFTNNLAVPKYVKLTGAIQGLSRLGIINRDFYTFLQREATTNFRVGYSLIDRRGLNQYKLQQFNLDYNYTVKKDNNLKIYNISPTGIELNINELTNSFSDKLNVRTLLSFQNQLVLGVGFRSFNFIRNYNSDLNSPKWQFLANIEQSGTEIFLLEKILGRTTPIRLFNNELDIARYWKGELSLSYSKALSTKTSYAARLSLGAAVPYQKDVINTPYSKLFFVGGPNSIRAWPIRGLGPGTLDASSLFDGVPFVASDIKFDFASEYRFPIFWKFNGAVFLDVANIWDIQKSTTNSYFTTNFYKELAIGSGFGLRIDATYAIIRIDFGYKLRTPYDTDNKSKWIGFTNPQWQYFNPNFALGLPF